MDNEKRQNWNDYVGEMMQGSNERMKRRDEIIARLQAIRKEIETNGSLKVYDDLQKEKQALLAELSIL